MVVPRGAKGSPTPKVVSTPPFPGAISPIASARCEGRQRAEMGPDAPVEEQVLLLIAEAGAFKNSRPRLRL